MIADEVPDPCMKRFANGLFFKSPHAQRNASSFKFDEKWYDFPIKPGAISHGHWIKKVAWFCGVPFVESLNSNKNSNPHGWAESVVKSSLEVSLVFPSFLDLYRFPSFLEEWEGLSDSWPAIVTISFTENPQNSCKIWKRFLDFKFVNSLVFFQNNWMWVNKFGFKY